MSNQSTDTIDIEQYNTGARREIDEWMHPEATVLSKALSVISTPIDKAGEALMNAPQFGDTVKDATEQMLLSLSDAANWSIDTQDILDDYKKRTTQPIVTVDDIQKLPLNVVDEQVKSFKGKYVAATSAQGVTTGLTGWMGIPADIVGLVTANLRAISEYATSYGFDMSQKGEQLFAMSLLSIATSVSTEEREAAVDETLDMIRDPETMVFNKVNEEIMSRVVRQTATKVATNLVKSKAAQFIPAVGAVVAGGVNANYTVQVCEAAYQCYRHRFLTRQNTAI